MITSYSQNSRTPIIVLMVVTSLNIGIMIGLILSITLGVTSTQIFVLAALEMAVVLFVYREEWHHNSHSTHKQ